jgi:hypothetical protein
MDSLLKELQKIYPYAEGLRNRDGCIEFAISMLNGELSWFSYHQLPANAEAFVDRMIKLSNGLAEKNLYREELEKAIPTQGNEITIKTCWISRKDKLPKSHETVIGINEKIDMPPVVVYYVPQSEEFFHVTASNLVPVSITHWFPIPEKLSNPDHKWIRIQGSQTYDKC